ncbi:MAG: cytochrome c oxidase assembly protein [Chloroflexi bacterium]|nr:MAG: cytochrome c oxidase assembly protein [Chloroflexota bacterium]
MVLVWGWRALETAVLLAISLVYLRGWWQVRQPFRLFPLSWFSMGAFYLGVLVYGVAVVSPLADLSRQYFSLRVTQHLLLVTWAPVLLLVGNPYAVLRAGVSGLWPGLKKRPFSRVSTLSPWLIRVTAPAPAWFLFTATFWLWYDPVLHQAGLHSSLVATVEQLTLSMSALLYWWHILSVSPRVHPEMPPLVHAAYALIGAWPIKVTGLILLFGNSQVYAYPNPMWLPGLGLDDYRLAAMIAWVLGGIVYSTTAVLLVRRWLSAEEAKPVLPESEWATPYSLIAPGLEHRLPPEENPRQTK